MRVYDHEYVDTIDDEGTESPLRAGEAVRLWHDAAFQIRHMPDRTILVNFNLIQDITVIYIWTLAAWKIVFYTLYYEISVPHGQEN